MYFVVKTLIFCNCDSLHDSVLEKVDCCNVLPPNVLLLAVCVCVGGVHVCQLESFQVYTWGHMDSIALYRLVSKELRTRCNWTKHDLNVFQNKRPVHLNYVIICTERPAVVAMIKWWSAAVTLWSIENIQIDYAHNVVPSVFVNRIHADVFSGWISTQLGTVLMFSFLQAMWRNFMFGPNI